MSFTMNIWLWLSNELGNEHFDLDLPDELDNKHLTFRWAWQWTFDLDLQIAWPWTLTFIWAWPIAKSYNFDIETFFFSSCHKYIGYGCEFTGPSCDCKVDPVLQHGGLWRVSRHPSVTDDWTSWTATVWHQCHSSHHDQKPVKSWPHLIHTGNLWN